MIQKNLYQILKTKMNKRIKNIIRSSFEMISKRAVLKAISQNQATKELWNFSLDILSDLSNHYATVRLSEEAEMRVRMLICCQVIFLKKIIDNMPNNKSTITYLDIGDSDGSVRLLLERLYDKLSLDSIGINLQQQAVDNIKQRGLNAECIDAMDLCNQKRSYDIVSVFETLEHLPNPIGFLENIHPIVNNRLIISVPLIVRSRVSLGYLNQNWPQSLVPTIANNHIFELNPQDLTKIFWHTGWEVEHKWKVRTFPEHGPLNWVMKLAWRRMSFEGWYFVSLMKNDKFSSKYRIE